LIEVYLFTTLFRRTFVIVSFTARFFYRVFMQARAVQLIGCSLKIVARIETYRKDLQAEPK